MNIQLACIKNKGADVSVWLEATSYGITLKAKKGSDEDENVWMLLSIGKTGFIKRHTSISSTLGIPLDSKGRIKVSKAIAGL
jgi:hypothetical protein